jgi:hypothetical protein
MVYSPLIPADSSSNYLPIHFKHLQATVYDLDTLKTIATGDWGSHTLPKGEQEPVILPVQFSYSALNQSDTACESTSSPQSRLRPS